MALAPFRRDFGLDGKTSFQRDTLQGNIVSTFQAGTFFGALLTFPLGEKIGRKRAIMVASTIFLIGGTLMTASNGMLGLLYAGRGIAGFGIGSVSLLVPVYIAETSPPSIRGRLVGIFEILSQGGGMLGFWINYAVNQTISDRLKTQWIIPLALQLLPGLFLLVGILWCPESPRWYAKTDQLEKAATTLSWIRGLPQDHPYIQQELAEIRAQNIIAKPPPGVKSGNKYMFKRLFQKGTRNRIGIGLLLMAFQNLTGVSRLKDSIHLRMPQCTDLVPLLVRSTSSHTTARVSLKLLASLVLTRSFLQLASTDSPKLWAWSSSAYGLSNVWDAGQASSGAHSLAVSPCGILEPT